MPPRKYTEAKKKANKSWDADNLDRISLAVPKGHKDKIKARAEGQGLSVNAYINKVIDEDINKGG